MDDVVLTVTYSPADVKSPKPPVDTLLTLPMDPPAAGPERAFGPPPPDPGGAPWAAAVAAVVAATELDVPPQADSPSAAARRPAVTHLLLWLDSKRRILERPADGSEVALVSWRFVWW